MVMCLEGKLVESSRMMFRMIELIERKDDATEEIHGRMNSIVSEYVECVDENLALRSAKERADERNAVLEEALEFVKSTKTLPLA